MYSSIRWIVLCLLPLALASLGGAEATAAPPDSSYVLYWHDEFDAGRIDDAKWGVRLPGRRGAKRRYSVNSLDMASVDSSGHLILVTDSLNGEVHTVQLETRGRFETTYGYFEARVRLPREEGHWFDFWLLNPTVHIPGNPEKNGVELDMLEYRAIHPDDYPMGLHWDGYKEHHKHAGKVVRRKGLQNGWQVIGCEWMPERYTFFHNGEPLWTHTDPVSQTSEYLVLSLLVGNFGGRIENASLPDSVLIDYVRVYKKSR